LAFTDFLSVVFYAFAVFLASALIALIFAFSSFLAYVFIAFTSAL